jgi:hypothetical protein
MKAARDKNRKEPEIVPEVGTKTTGKKCWVRLTALPRQLSNSTRTRWVKTEMERKALVKKLEQGLACCRDREEESQRMTPGKRPEGT